MGYIFWREANDNGHGNGFEEGTHDSISPLLVARCSPTFSLNRQKYWPHRPVGKQLFFVHANRYRSIKSFFSFQKPLAGLSPEKRWPIEFTGRTHLPNRKITRDATQRDTSRLARAFFEKLINAAIAKLLSRLRSWSCQLRLQRD